MPLYVVGVCKIDPQSLCKNWTGESGKGGPWTEAGPCPQKAEGCPYLVEAKKRE